MRLNKIIQKKRKELEYTQEQIANYLGVSTPAVNKWEKGVSLPDISLLAPLARLLKTDVNTLLSFKEELTQSEITLFCEELSEVYQTDGFDVVYENIQEKLREYPNNMKLIYHMTFMLDGFTLFSGMSKEQKKPMQDRIFKLYEQLLNSEDTEEKNSAAFMLSSKYIVNGDYEKAQEMIDILPDFNPMNNPMNKYALQANLYVAEGKYKEAIKIREGILVRDAINVWNHLLSLQELKLKQKLILEAEQIANICKTYAATMELPEFHQIVPLFQQAINKKDMDNSIKLLKQLISAAKKIQKQLNHENSVLYRESGFENKKDLNHILNITSVILQEINTGEEYTFLKESPEFEKIISNAL